MKNAIKLIILSTLSILMACEPKTSTPAPSEAPVTEAEPAKPTAEATKPAEEAKPEDKKEEDPAAAADSKILGVGKTPEDIKAGESNVYGARFTIIEEPIELAAAIDKASSAEGPYKVNAKIEKVCQVKGCWFTLKSEGVEIPIRVKMKDYAFFVPKNAEGLPAVLEGTFKKTQLPQDEAQHYADDEAKATGKPAKKIEGPLDTYMFMASAIQITKPADG